MARVSPAEGEAHEPAALLRRFGGLRPQRVLASRRQRLRQIGSGPAQDHRLGPALRLITGVLAAGVSSWLFLLCRMSPRSPAISVAPWARRGATTGPIVTGC